MEQSCRASSEKSPRINTEELSETTKNLSQVSGFAAEIRQGEISENRSNDTSWANLLGVHFEENHIEIHFRKCLIFGL